MSRLITFANRFITTLCVLVATGASATDEADPQLLEQMRADCQIEGEAGGLDGAELKEFVDQCVADLMAVQFINLE